ncbi:YnfA family protein [Peribacillus sp. NPDC056705]|uniref:YnfA family protein n=1 Tax=Peribacillus sp. NPDC056705 TaxID=3345918 RepID=UPI00374978FA
MVVTTLIFIMAGLAEIGGGYLIWLWLREGKSIYLGLAGGFGLVLYGIIATFQTFPTFGRVYAAYGGVFHRPPRGKRVSGGEINHTALLGK